MRLTGVRIETADLASDAARYGTLLGVEPLETARDVRRFQLGRGAVELAAGEPGHATVLFARDEPTDEWPAGVDGFHELPVAIEPAAPPPSRTLVDDAATAVDHVVVFTPDPSRAIAFWRDRVGMRLAFDREFPERKVRLVFFRSGGLTFEFASALPLAAETSAPDRFYGVSYRVPDLALRRTALLAAGFDVSEIRRGNKAGTQVASVRDHTAGVATLLLAEEPR
jgi:catechol 2,3-dioxygenase-like lactoylglutathione lyase family enzyme